MLRPLQVLDRLQFPGICSLGCIKFGAVPFPAACTWSFSPPGGCSHSRCSGTGGRRGACAARRRCTPCPLSRISTAVRIKPGVQKPHWMAASSTKACWMSLSSPLGPSRPSSGADVLALGPYRQIDAGVEGLAVDEDGAGAALPHLAALFHAGHAEVIAQHVRQDWPAHPPSAPRPCR